jgi:hypothetical protein
VSFKLPDGTVFGLFICFDIMYAQPSQGLLAQGITHFAYPTSFVNSPPLLDATMMQQAWSRRFAPAVLVAANNGASGSSSLPLPSISKSGSGIYVSGEAVEQYFDPMAADAADEKFMVSEVPRTLNGSRRDGDSGRRTGRGDTVASYAAAAAAAAGVAGVAGVAVDASAELGAAIEEAVVPCGVVGSKWLHCTGFKSAPGASGSITASYGDLTCRLNYTFASNATAGELYAILVRGEEREREREREREKKKKKKKREPTLDCSCGIVMATGHLSNTLVSLYVWHPLILPYVGYPVCRRSPASLG